jgi:hypothetical protein
MAPSTEPPWLVYAGAARLEEEREALLLMLPELVVVDQSACQSQNVLGFTVLGPALIQRRPRLADQVLESDGI